jgi:hypothetical protein
MIIVFIPPFHRRRVYCFNSICPSVQDIFIPPLHPRGGGILFYLCLSVQVIFLSDYWWQKSDIWSQASYRYAILWETFLDTSDPYFLFADLVGFYTHWTYMRGYHKWALAHSSSCCCCFWIIQNFFVFSISL